MKAKIDGFEVEGTPEEIAAFVKALRTVQIALSPTPPVIVPSFQVLSDACPMGGAHEYPTVWMSVSPPACQKCGQAGPSLPQWTVTYDSWDVLKGPALPYTTVRVGDLAELVSQPASLPGHPESTG